MWSQPPRLGMGEAELLIGRGDDAHARLGQVARFVRRDREAERRRVDDDETVAAIGDVDFERAQALDLERRVEPVGERGHVFDRDALGLAVAALGGDGDQARRAPRA